MATNRRTTHVRSHTRRDGTRVSSYNRQDAWRQAGAAWAGAGISGLTTLALVAEMGLTIVSAIALVITALLGLVAVYASQQATKNKRKMRSTIKARKRAGRSGRGRARSSARRGSARRRR